jgi:C4-dicarboxylate transporter DctM subunit
MAGALVSLVAGQGVDPIAVVAIMFSKVNVISLVAVPLFVLCGELLARGGSAKPLIEFFNKFMGHIPGGPAYAVILACAVMASMSSIAMAAVAAFAPIVIPMMTEMGYSRRFSIGLLVTASTLGPLIPPSIPLILYGYITDTSVKDLYSAAFLPGALVAMLLAVTVFVYSRRGHYVPPPQASWKERWWAVRKAWPVLLMPIVVLAPIYLGWDTPTEAAAVAAVYSLFLGLVVYRELTLRKLWEACSRTVHVVSAIMVILMAAFLLNTALVYMRVPFTLSDAITGAGLNWATFLMVLIVLYLLMGCFLDPSAMLLIVTPLLFPTVQNLGISPVLFGVLVVMSIEIAGVTPPYGITLFVASSVLGEKFHSIARACFMFYPALIVGQLLVAYVPKISLFLPGL